MERFELGSASVQYGDWKGEAAADEHLTVGHPSLNELAGLDPERWWIVGLDINGLHERDVYVYAVDRATTGIAGHDSLASYVAEHGEVPVTSFLLHKVTAESVIHGAFNQFTLRFRSRALDGLGAPVVVTALDDVGYDGD